MVGDLEFTTVVLVLYVLECFHKVRPDEIVFDRAIGSWIRRPILYPGNGSWGWLILNPLRPDGPVFSTTPSSLLMTGAGVVGNSQPMSDTALFAYESCRSASTDDDKVVVDGGWIRANSTTEAKRLALALRQLAKAPAKKRLERLRHLQAEAFSVDAIEETCKKYRQCTSLLRATNKLLLVVYFLGFPALLALIGLKNALLSLLPSVILLSATAALFYRRSVHLLMPTTPKIELYTNAVKLILYPLSGLRCMEMISYHTLSSYDPIAVAYVLCGNEHAARIASHEMVGLRYGTVPSNVEGEVAEAIMEYRQTRLSLIETFCAEHGISLKPDSAPSPEFPNVQSYCPSCGVQYSLKDGVCADCTAIALQPIKIDPNRQ